MSTQKRGDTYYSRIVVPTSLHHIIPRREVVKSLHTQAYSTARLQCAQWEARLYGLLETLRTRGQELSGLEFDAELRKLADPQHGGPNHEAQSNTPAPSSTSSVPQQATSEALSVVIGAYLQEHRGGSWTDKTAETIEGCLKDFAEILGDMPAPAVTRASLRIYKECLQRLPPNRTKKFPGMAIAELVCRPHPRTLSSTTINRNLGFVSSFFTWAALNSYVPANPTAGAKLKIRRSTAADEERLPFTNDDLSRIFGGDYSTLRSTTPERYWIPLLMLCSGARLEEIAQLRAQDVRQTASVWTLHLTAEGKSQRLKTQSSKRVVPIHSELIRRGFLDYHAEALRGKRGELWPGLKADKFGRRSAGLSKWFNNRLRSIGITDARKVLYSTRHTVSTTLKHQGVPEYAIAELLGHKVDGISVSRYGKKLEPLGLVPIVEGLPFSAATRPIMTSP